jgi:hypothetical protein
MLASTISFMSASKLDLCHHPSLVASLAGVTEEGVDLGGAKVSRADLNKRLSRGVPKPRQTIFRPIWTNALATTSRTEWLSTVASP